MAHVHPFRGIYYNAAKVGDLSAVVTQPYDRIDPVLQESYYARHPFNAVRLTKEKELPGDRNIMQKYERSAAALQQWLREEILIRDPEPSMYVHHQTYTDGPERKTRKGVVGLVQVEDPGLGRIFPHEMTHTQPKVDRLNLLRIARAHFGHVFMLYSDPRKKISSAADPGEERPFLTATDDFGVLHQAWRITDPGRIRAIQKEMERQDLIIADGHHRYETTLYFRNEFRQKHPNGPLPLSVQTRLATFINMDDEGLTIYPTHRVVHGIPFSFAHFRAQLNAFFQVLDYPFSDPAGESEAWMSLIEDLRLEGVSRVAMGCVVKDPPSLMLCLVRDPSAVDRWIPDKKSRDWKMLSVNILHKVILEKMLGIGEQHLAAEKNVSYLRDAEEVRKKVREESCPAGFLLNPVTLGQIKTIVKNRECFPQKTTDFYPKLLTGWIMNQLDA